MSRHEVELIGSAKRDLDRLDGSASGAVGRFLKGPLRNNPRRAGELLDRANADMYEALGPGWRVLYQVDDERGTVHVVVIGRRMDQKIR